MSFTTAAILDDIGEYPASAVIHADTTSLIYRDTLRWRYSRISMNGAADENYRHAGGGTVAHFRFSDTMTNDAGALSRHAETGHEDAAAQLR